MILCCSGNGKRMCVSGVSKFRKSQIPLVPALSELGFGGPGAHAVVTVGVGGKLFLGPRL